MPLSQREINSSQNDVFYIERLQRSIDSTVEPWPAHLRSDWHYRARGSLLHYAMQSLKWAIATIQRAISTHPDDRLLQEEAACNLIAWLQAIRSSDKKGYLTKQQMRELFRTLLVVKERLRIQEAQDPSLEKNNFQKIAPTDHQMMKQLFGQAVKKAAQSSACKSLDFRASKEDDALLQTMILTAEENLTLPRNAVLKREHLEALLNKSWTSLDLNGAKFAITHDDYSQLIEFLKKNRLPLTSARLWQAGSVDCQIFDWAAQSLNLNQFEMNNSYLNGEQLRYLSKRGSLLQIKWPGGLVDCTREVMEELAKKQISFACPGPLILYNPSNELLHYLRQNSLHELKVEASSLEQMESWKGDTYGGEVTFCFNASSQDVPRIRDLLTKMPNAKFEITLFNKSKSQTSLNEFSNASIKNVRSGEEMPSRPPAFYHDSLNADYDAWLEARLKILKKNPHAFLPSYWEFKTSYADFKSYSIQWLYWFKARPSRGSFTKDLAEGIGDWVDFAWAAAKRSMPQYYHNRNLRQIVLTLHLARQRLERVESLNDAKAFGELYEAAITRVVSSIPSSKFKEAMSALSMDNYRSIWKPTSDALIAVEATAHQRLKFQNVLLNEEHFDQLLKLPPENIQLGERCYFSVPLARLPDLIGFLEKKNLQFGEAKRYVPLHLMEGDARGICYKQVYDWTVQWHNKSLVASEYVLPALVTGEAVQYLCDKLKADSFKFEKIIVTEPANCMEHLFSHSKGKITLLNPTAEELKSLQTVLQAHPEYAERLEEVRFTDAHPMIKVGYLDRKNTEEALKTIKGVAFHQGTKLVVTVSFWRAYCLPLMQEIKKTSPQLKVEEVLEGSAVYIRTFATFVRNCIRIARA